MADPNIETTIESLGVTEVQEYEYFLKAFVDANLDNVDTGKGSVFYDLMIRPDAVFKQLSNLNINRWRRSASLLEISRDPTLADPAIVDALMSNYGVTRAAGRIPTGPVTILLSSNVTTVIPAGSVFASGTLLFSTTRAYIGVPTSDLVTKDTDQLIAALGDGVYSFEVQVTAAESGEAFQLSQGDCLTMQAPPSNYVSAQATSDFSVGASAETNTELMTELATGISGKTTASRKHVRSLASEAYPNIKHGSVIGFGDVEMQRDKLNIFNTSFGGKSDIYLQTDVRPIKVVTTKVATLMDAGLSKWQLYFDRDEFAGVYKIASIKPKGSTALGGFAITTDIRDFDITPLTVDSDSFIPAIDSYTQAAFSRYQTATIEFADSETDASEMTPITTTQEYDITLIRLPDIASIQDDLVSDYWVSSHRYDDLVRAPIPCLTSLSIALRVPQGTEVNQTSIKAAVAARINELNFTNKLSSSIIADVVHNFIDTNGSVTMPVDMFGEVIDPEDGSSVVYRSGTTLTIPEDYSKSMTERTIMFFVDPGDIDIYVETY